MKRLSIYIFILLATLTCDLFAQSNIRVQGVVATPSGTAIEGASIIYNSYLVATSNIDGRFSALLPRDAEILTYHKDYNKVKTNINGRQEIEVILQEQNQEIAVVTVTTQATQKAIVIDNSDIEIKGDYFHLKTKFRIPEALFTTDKRYIVQPTLYNATKRQRINLAPVVIDGDKYTLNLNRRLNFDLNNDSLHRFVVENTLNETDNIYQYHDSLFIAPQNRDHDYRADCYQALVGYSAAKDKIKIDTITIAQGTKNPLRFLDYTFEPMDLDTHVLSLSDGSTVQLEYSSLKPEPELELMTDRGSSEIEFKVNRTDIDYSSKTNRENIETIVELLNTIKNNENATLRSITMTGYASPEGEFSKNKVLANLRTKSLLDVVTNTIDPEILKYTELTYTGEVQPWASLIDLAKEDNNSTLADKLTEAIERYGDNNNSIQSAIVRMPEYRKIIKPRYLPQLRRVDYSIDYSIFRPMTFEEIKAIAESGEKRLSRFDYYKLINEEIDSAKIVKFENEALRHYPNFVWNLNRVAVRILKQDSTNLDLMAPIIGLEVPMPVTYNHALMALNTDNIALADSLIHIVSQYRECNYLRSIILALNGEFSEAYPYISSRGGLNEVLIMLSMDEDKESFRLVSNLIVSEEYKSSAKAWYIHALCANRLNLVSEAISSLTHAFSLDSSLIEVARLDSDILDICELIVPQKRYE